MIAFLVISAASVMAVFAAIIFIPHNPNHCPECMAIDAASARKEEL